MERRERRSPSFPLTRSEGPSCILGWPRGLPCQRGLGFPGRKGPLELGNVRLREVVTGPRSSSSWGGLQLRLFTLSLHPIFLIYSFLSTNIYCMPPECLF